MNKIIAIAAVDLNGAIGYQGNLVWKNRADINHFRNTTMGHSVLMGRKTWQSLGGRGLHGRECMVITVNGHIETKTSIVAKGAKFAPSIELGLKRLGQQEKIFIAGGGQIYANTAHLWDEAIITHAEYEAGQADAYFPMAALAGMEVVEEQKFKDFKIVRYERRRI